MMSNFRARSSYLADLSGDGLTVPVHVIEYDVTVDGQDVPEMFHARTRRAAIAAIRVGRTCYQAFTREIAKYRVITDRHRHRHPGSFAGIPP